jgi:tRNA(Ile)-lysidine synthase
MKPPGLLSVDFSAEMARLGPFGAHPRIAAGVSGGADSTALALLAAAWVKLHGGTFRALIVDHGLRAESAAEAALTAARLAARQIDSQIITLQIAPGPALQARARDARLAALTQAAFAAGCLHLLLGHQRADQAETVAMRAARGPGGAEGIAAWSARADILILRPLLAQHPATLRAYLESRGMAWVEDPSNHDPRFERARIRAQAPEGNADPGPRRAREAEVARFLGRHATISPLGFATLHADAVPPAALAALLRVIGGAAYPPPAAATARLATALRPATLQGVRISRVAQGWRLTREAAAVAPAICCHTGDHGQEQAQAPVPCWDNRFTLTHKPPAGSHFGAMGGAAAGIGTMRHLPAAVRTTLPALRLPGSAAAPVAVRFTPPAPACPGLFFA